MLVRKRSPGKKTQAVRGEVAEQKKDGKNTRYARKAAQPAAQAQPLADLQVQSTKKVLAVGRVVAARIVKGTWTRIIRRIAIQTTSLQPLAELKWSRQPFAEKHPV